MVSKEATVTIAMLLLITYTASLSAVSQVYPASQVSTTFSTTGSIQIQATAGIGIYSDYSCNNELNTVSWGTLEAGGSQSIDCYIKNEGSSPITLSLETSNWYPTSAASYLSLSWNYSNQPIAAGSSIHIALTLSASSNIEGITNFSVDITIVGTG
jgi:hypothetical protein